MKRSCLLISLLLCSLAIPALAEEDLDVTLTVIDEEGTIDENFVNEIMLPDTAAEQARENARNGVEVSNQARQQGQNFGAERAQAAGDNGAQNNRQLITTPPAH